MRRIKANGLIYKYVSFVLAAVFSVMMTSPNSITSAESECPAPSSQTVVRWKDMYWYPCQYSWNGICLWPIRRKHITYKVTVHEGVPWRDENGLAVAVAGGIKKDWTVHDAVTWNSLVNDPDTKNRFQDYEPIANNEFVVLVETRYRWFNNVESTVRICTQ